jgi:hypothetical protein
VTGRTGEAERDRQSRIGKNSLAVFGNGGLPLAFVHEHGYLREMSIKFA